MSVFQHGVASGDPLQDRVILWTRLTLPEKKDLQLEWEIAQQPDFKRVLVAGFDSPVIAHPAIMHNARL